MKSQCLHVQTSLAEDLLSRTDEEIGGHLAVCPACRRLCDELLELEDLSRSLSGRFRVPMEFRDQVLSRLEQRKSRRRRRIGIAAAALLVAVVASAFVLPWKTPGASPAANVRQATDPQMVAPAAGQSQSAPGYVDIIVDQDGSDGMILRVPSVIEIHRTQIQEDFYINNVSH